MGRKTYEGLAGYWAPLEGPWADRLNAMPKFVGSRTLHEPLEWNARLLEGEGDIAESVPNLKNTIGGDLFMSGCGEFARELLARDLVDELRFWIHPALWSTGIRPFEGEPIKLRLLGSRTFDSGVTLLRSSDRGPSTRASHCSATSRSQRRSARGRLVGPSLEAIERWALVCSG